MHLPDPFRPSAWLATASVAATQTATGAALTGIDLPLLAGALLLLAGALLWRWTDSSGRRER